MKQLNDPDSENDKKLIELVYLELKLSKYVTQLYKIEAEFIDNKSILFTGNVLVEFFT